MDVLNEAELNEYIIKEKLNELIDFNENSEFKEGPYDAVSGKLSIPFPPVKQDLVQLHKFIREKHCFTVLEFGCGYSTIIIADALAKNQKDFEKIQPQPILRNRFQFQLFSVDTSKKWIKITSKRIPTFLKNRIHLEYSSAKIGTYQDQLCSYYTNLPDIVPDFIYLDGPDPQVVKGKINGLSFKCLERTVTSGDILLMESILLPKTYIYVDGRVNNTRFLERNFKRNFKKEWHPQLDITVFELDEPRLGKYNLIGTDFFS